MLQENEFKCAPVCGDNTSSFGGEDFGCFFNINKSQIVKYRLVLN